MLKTPLIITRGDGRDGDTLRACETCGAPHRGSYGSGRFCAKACAASFATSKGRAEISAKTSATNTAKHTRIIACAGCGEQFRAPRKRSRYCARACTPQRNRTAAQYSAMGRRSAASVPRRSRGEIALAELCSAQGWTITTNDPIFSGWDADILIHDLRIAVHYDGPCHRRKIYQGQSLDQIQTRDRIKRRQVRSHGWTNHTIADDGSYSAAFVRAQFARLVSVAERKETMKESNNR